MIEAEVGCAGRSWSLNGSWGARTRRCEERLVAIAGETDDIAVGNGVGNRSVRRLARAGIEGWRRQQRQRRRGYRMSFLTQAKG